MQQELNEAIALLQRAAAMPEGEARGPVLQAMELLAAALKDETGMDVDKGLGS
jgi:hypothetical protein